MTVQDFFEIIDKTFGLGYMPLIYIAIISAVCFTLPLIFLFKPFAQPKNVVPSNPKDQKLFCWFKAHWPFVALFLCIALLAYRSIQVLFLVNFRVASPEYVVSSVLTVIFLVPLLFSKLAKTKGRFLLFIVLAFVLTGEPLVNNLLNGAEVSETTVDTLNIFSTGHWQFSFHNPSYDALPYDSVLKVFMLNVFGIANPTSVLPKILVDCCVSLILVFAVVLFVSYLGYSLQMGLLASVFVCSLPYLQLAFSPTNLSFAFGALFIMLLAKNLKSDFKPFYILLSCLFIVCGILAHEMAVLILLVPLSIVLFVYLCRLMHRENKIGLTCPVISKRLLNLTIFGLIVFVITIMYTRALTTTYNYAAVYLRNLLEGIVNGPGLTGSNFENTPVSIKVSLLLPVAIVGAFLISNLIRSRQQKDNFFNPKPNNLIFFGLYASVIITGLFASLSLLGTYTMSKHFGIFMFLYLGLGIVPVLAFLFNEKGPLTHSGLTKNLIVIIILLTVLLGFLAPHKMPDQYLSTVAFRGGNSEDLQISDFLAKHVTEAKSNVSLVQNLNTTKYTISIALYVASFKQLLFTRNSSEIGMYPTSNTTYLIYPASDLDIQTRQNLDSMQLVYSARYYDGFVKG